MAWQHRRMSSTLRSTCTRTCCPATPQSAPQLRCRRFLALARAKLYWMVPCWGGPGTQQLPVETQLLLLELEARATRAGACCVGARRLYIAAWESRLCSGVSNMRGAKLQLAHPSDLPPLPPPHQQDGSYGLLAPLIECDSFRASIRPPRPRHDPPGSLLLRLESGDESVKANKFEGERRALGRLTVLGKRTAWAQVASAG